MRINGSVIAWLASVLSLVACGGTSSNPLLGRDVKHDAGVECAKGHERCPCYGNDTCNAGLTCASALCVRLPGPANGVDASTDAASGGGQGDSSNAGGRTGSGGAPASGGKRASGGAVVGSGGVTGKGGAVSGGAPGSGGRVLSGGTPGSGGTLATGGSPDDAGNCPSGDKFCGGLCTPPAPRVGCGLTGCAPCTITAPMNGYVTCANGQCVFDCLSGYKKNGDKCEGNGAGGSAGNCNPTSCPPCNVVTGAACCTSDGKCGCPAVPWVAPTCAAN